MKFAFFSVSENRENGLGDEEANFWARTVRGIQRLNIQSLELR